MLSFPCVPTSIGYKGIRISSSPWKKGELRRPLVIYLGNSNPVVCVETCGVFFIVHHRAPFFDNGGKLDG